MNTSVLCNAYILHTHVFTKSFITEITVPP